MSVCIKINGSTCNVKRSPDFKLVVLGSLIEFPVFCCTSWNSI